MKKIKIGLGVSVLAIAGLLVVAADHIDAPNVTGGSSDITDFYAFQGENPNNVVFVANVQGLMSPAQTAEARFDEDVMIEINIDTDGDQLEDFVIQAIPYQGKMYFFGPGVPSQTGLNSQILPNIEATTVDITPYGANAIVKNQGGLRYFAGPRDDPFFMDFAQYGEIIAGNATSFNDPGNDTFAGTNVMSIAVELPKSLLGGSGNVSTWVETKRKQ